MSGKVKFQSFLGSDRLMCMLSTFCPPVIWAISLEFGGKPSILEANYFLGACCGKAVSPKKLWTLFCPNWVSNHGSLEERKCHFTLKTLKTLASCPDAKYDPLCKMCTVSG